MVDPRPTLEAALADRYHIVRELGRGGMATVFLAEDVKLHRQVALKVLRPELAASLGSDRFLREIEIAARLTHPHILQLHDSGVAGKHLYYAMPYVEGESLRHRLEREGQLPVDQALSIIQAVASALSYAHHQRVVHRDIKPENILLAKGSDGSSPYPLVADFGIARALDVAGGERLTETGLALGTPAYMSPEQSAADHRLDGRSDIYALGCVAYEMLAGQPPFTGPTAQAILARHAVDPVPPLHTVRSTIPPAVEAAIEQALAKVPADRFSTADEFAHALTAEHVRMPLKRKLTSRRAKVALVMAAAVAAAGLGATLLGKSPPRVVPSAATMAILPFFAGGTDTALSRLGRDLAVTLSASLDGIGGIETADRLTVANATADRNSLTPGEGAALARRLGSSSFLRGTLVRAGDNVRLDLGLYSTQGLAPLAEGITVTAHRDSIGTLTDSASWALLRQVWQRGEPPSPSLADITSRSLPALRSFLEGERQLGANQWDKAALAFKSAIAADSGFALAHFRYALTQWWTQQQPGPDVLRVLRAQRQALSERERMLVDAFLTSHRSPKLQIERYQAAAQRFPDYWPAWFLYADALFHQGPAVGHDRSRGLEAFRRVVALNPKLVPALEHLFDLTVAWDKTEASAVYARLVELGWLESQPPGGRLASRLLASVAGLETNDRLNRDQLMDSLANFMCCGTRAVPSQADFLAVEFEPLFLLQAGFPAAQLELNRRALRSGRMPDRVTVALQAANAWACAARGRWDSATVLISRVATVHPGPLQGRRPVLAVESYGLAVLGAWLGATSPDSADARRPAALGVLSRLAEEDHKQEVRGRVAWFDGLLAHARGDRRAIQAARRAALESGDYQADRIERSLAAFERALAGDRKGAGHALELLNETCLENCNSFTPYDGVQHFAAAQWLGESGDSERAAKLLRWPDRDWQGWLWTIDDALAGPGFLARARIEESRGRDSLAQEYYRQFLRRYDRPMPSQAHLVQEARTALARLQQDP